MSEKNLKKILEELGKLEEKRAIEITKQICLGLEAIHSLGYIHRDINLRNILIDDEGKVEISDLGLLKQSEDSDKSVYAAPEQHIQDSKGRFNCSLESDIYSVGVILYEMLTGELPVDSVNQEKKIDNSFINSLDIENADKVLVNIIKKCIQPNPDDRYSSAGELYKALSGNKDLNPILVLDFTSKRLISHLNKETKYGTTDTKYIKEILNLRKRISEYVFNNNMGDEAKNTLDQLDSEIEQKRKRDFEVIHRFIRPDLSLAQSMKEFIADGELVDKTDFDKKCSIFYELSGKDCWCYDNPELWKEKFK